MYPVICKFGPVTIYTYGLMTAVGCTVGYLVVSLWAAREGFDEDHLINLFILFLVSAVGGARLTFVLTYPEYFRGRWLKAFALWQGGLTIMGGGVAVFLSFILYCWYYRLNTAYILDLFAAAFPLGVFFGRIGCFCNGCCFGKPSDLPWAVVFTRTDPLRPPVPRHPTQLYGAIVMILLFLLLRWYRSRPHTDGMVTVLFLYMYCLYRFPIEFIRGDVTREHFLFGLSLAQTMSIAVLAVAFCVHVFWLRKKSSGRAVPVSALSG